MELDISYNGINMMGIHNKQDELWVEAVNLGHRIPEEHILRKFAKVLDLGLSGRPWPASTDATGMSPWIR